MTEDKNLEMRMEEKEQKFNKIMADFLGSNLTSFMFVALMQVASICKESERPGARAIAGGAAILSAGTSAYLFYRGYNAVKKYIVK